MSSFYEEVYSLLKGEKTVSYYDKKIDWNNSSSPMSIDKYNPSNYGSFKPSYSHYNSSMGRVTPNIGGRLN